MRRDRARRPIRFTGQIALGENGAAMNRPRALEIGGFVAVLLVGFILRAVPVVGHAWPVGDGGLFYQMVGELRANGLALPATTTYDHAGIPFAYPPLALELAAVLESITGLARADVFRWLPLTFATLCVPAVYLVVSELQPDRVRALFATLVYATLPFAWEWLTMGSGVTRSVGGFLALLAVWQGLRMYREGRPIQVLATGVLAGLAVLSHPEAGPFVVIALGARLIFELSWRNLRNLVLAGVVGVVVIAPWVVAVASRHGLAPFAAAAGVGHDPVASLVLYAFGFFLVSPLPVAAVLDVLGQVRNVLSRRPFLVVWRFALCFLDLRFALVAAVIPLSLLASEGFFDVLMPAVRSLARRSPRALSPAVASAGHRARIGGAARVEPGGAQRVPGAPRGPCGEDRAAMDWVRATQPADRKFLVLATDTWGSDDLSEWFPALTGRASLDTSQGLEWVAPAIRQAEADSEVQLRACQPAAVRLPRGVACCPRRHGCCGLRARRWKRVRLGRRPLAGDPDRAPRVAGVPGRLRGPGRRHPHV